MPTVLRLNGFRVVIYPHDHRPAHVFSADSEAVFFLNCPDGLPEFAGEQGLRQAATGRLRDALASHVTDLCADGG